MSGLSGADVIQQSLSPAEGGVTVQGERATTVGERGVSVSGNVQGSIITGQVQLQSSPQMSVYFHLRILEAQDDESEPNFDAPLINKLEPSKRYWVVVWTDVNGDLDQKSVLVRSSLSLALEVEGKNGVQAITIANPLGEITKEKVEDFEHVYELITANELPHGRITLNLVYRQGDSRLKKGTAVTQHIDLAGTHNPVDPGLLKACHINLAVERPAQTAIIHVENAGAAGQIQLTCWGYYANRTLRTAPFVPPKVCLADFIEAQEDPLTILGKLRTFSSDHPDLRLISWINRLRQRLGETMMLIIVDHTDSEIPWEMLELKDGVYLGAVVPIARWLPVPYYDKYIHLEVHSEQRSGQVLVYLDEQELPHSANERQQLSHFIAEFHPDTQKLQNGLRESLAEIGLVYLACHGIFTPSTNEVVFGSWHNPSNRLLPLQLEHLPYHESPRPVLFVNACHSARVKRHDQKLHGLPIVMLKRIASGYIGTLGPVNSAFASQMASTIFTAIRNEAEGTSPVELLRLLRASAADQLNANKELPNQLHFIYTFMYVYYGNPLTYLRLLPTQAVGDTDE